MGVLPFNHEFCKSVRTDEQLGRTGIVIEKMRC